MVTVNLIRDHLTETRARARTLRTRLVSTERELARIRAHLRLVEGALQMERHQRKVAQRALANIEFERKRHLLGA